MRFKIGDIVICREKFTDGPGWNLSMEEWLGKPMTIKRITVFIEVKENEWCWLESSLELLSMTTKSKEEQLSDKITYLYERQQWVKEGKKEASYYTKQAAPSVENKDTIEPGITLPYTQTDTNIVLSAPILTEAQRTEMARLIITRLLNTEGQEYLPQAPRERLF